MRARVPKEAMSLFMQEELQKPGGALWQVVHDQLWSLGPALLDLFDQAWTSSCLKDCPDFATWHVYLESARCEMLRSASSTSYAMPKLLRLRSAAVAK